MQSRRKILQSIGLGTAGAVLFTNGAGAASTESKHHGASMPAPWWLIAPLGPESTLRGGWQVDALGPIEDGASVLSLRRRSESLNIHLCLHDGKPKGIAYSELFDLIVMDHGCGVRAVPENLASALLLLSEIIRQNEWSDVPNNQLDGIHRMMTHAERVSSFGASHLQ